MSADAEPQQPRPLTGGAVMSATSRVTVAATGAAATILVARLLGPDGTGAYAIAQTLILLLTVATTLGVEHGVAYYVSCGRWAAHAAYRASQRVALASGLVGVLLALAARLIVPAAFDGLSVGVTLAAAAALPFALAWLYATYVALAVDRYEAYALPPAVQSTLALVLVAALAALDGIRGAVIGFTLGHVLTAVGVWAVAGRAIAPRTGTDAPGEPGQLRRAIRFGVKGYASNALQMLNYRLDVFILAAVASAADVGHYAVAVAVTGVMWLLPSALSDVLFPRIAALSARADESGHEARAFVETKSLRHTVVVVVVSSVVLALALLLLVVPVYGEDFRPAIELGLILLPGVALIGIAGTLSATIVGHGRPGFSLVVALVTTPVTIGLYLLLIPPYAATGAALASSISYGLSFVMAGIFYRHVTGAPLLPRLVPTRSELADYRALPVGVAEWLRGLRARRATG